MNDKSEVTVSIPAMLPRASSPAVSVFVTQDVADHVTQALSGICAQVKPITDGGLGDALTAAVAPIGLIWDTPATAVAQALLDGRDPAPAITDWIGRHRDLLALFRRYRRRIRLCDGRMFSPLASAEDLPRAASWLGLGRVPDLQCCDTPDVPALARLLVSRAVSRLDGLRGCLDELEASSLTADEALLPLSALARSVDGFDRLKRLAEDLQKGQDRADLHAREITLLRDQIGLQLEEMSRLQELQEAQRALADRSEQAAKEIATLKSDLADATRAAEDARETLRSRDEAWRTDSERHAREITLLRDQIGLQLEEMSRLRELQAEEEAEAERRHNILATDSERALARALSDLRSEARQRKALQDRFDEMQSRLAAVEEERNGLAHTVDDLYNSRSWRITKPLRQVRLMVTPIDVPDQNAQDGS